MRIKTEEHRLTRTGGILDMKCSKMTKVYVMIEYYGAARRDSQNRYVILLPRIIGVKEILKSLCIGARPASCERQHRAGYCQLYGTVTKKNFAQV